MNIYCLTQFLRAKISKRLSWGGEGAVWFRVSCVAAIRLGLQLLKAWTVLELLPGSLPCCWRNDPALHCVSPPRAAHRMGLTSLMGMTQRKEPQTKTTALYNLVLEGPRHYFPHHLLIGHTGYPWVSVERTIQGCEPQDGKAYWAPCGGLGLMPFNKITLIPHTLIAVYTSRLLAYWISHYSAHWSSRYQEIFTKCNKCFFAFIKSMWELEWFKVPGLLLCVRRTKFISHGSQANNSRDKNKVEKERCLIKKTGSLGEGESCPETSNPKILPSHIVFKWKREKSQWLNKVGGWVLLLFSIACRLADSSDVILPAWSGPDCYMAFGG